jgi:hypothetical protein
MYVSEVVRTNSVCVFARFVGDSYGVSPSRFSGGFAGLAPGPHTKKQTLHQNDNSISMQTPTIDDYMFLFQSELVPKRRVQFAPIVKAVPANPLQRDSWYSRDELNQFKMEAREIILHSLGENSLTSSLSSSSNTERGFECVAPQRRKHRRMSIQCTLSAARNGLGPAELSMVAQKCSQWSQKAAFLQACHDWATVYQPELSQRIPELQSPIFPFAVKRCSNGGDAGEHRRVRRRVSAPL